MAVATKVASCDWLDTTLRRRLLRYARQLVGDAGEAEDLAQETLLRVGRGLDSLREGDRVEAWIFRICRHVAIDHLRRRRVRRHLWARLPQDVGELAEASSVASAVPVAASTDLDALTPHQRVLLALHHVRGVPQATLCRMSGLSAPALRVRLFRARRSLRDRALDERSRSASAWSA